MVIFFFHPPPPPITPFHFLILIGTGRDVPILAAMASRRLRTFKRWMTSNGIECSDALALVDGGDEHGILVRANCDLSVGDVVSKIPKQSCLTIKTSSGREMIEEADLDGFLGLAVAIMYEKSLGSLSPWFGYLQVMPESESIPLLWTLDEIDSLLVGTELHKIIKDDKGLVREDWKECICPLLSLEHLNLNPVSFGLEQYLAAKSLIASRSFQIDDYHGYGMVPLSDLFNHKTGAEDVHFTSGLESDSDSENSNNDMHDDSIVVDEDVSSGDNRSESPVIQDDNTALEMIMVKDVKAGTEVFNTYGSLGNAALLHRYGFTEPDNPFDIVNVDLDLVLQWSCSLYSKRHSRARLSLWRKLGHSSCSSQNSEYFEISSDGIPQIELMILLYVMLLPDEAYEDLDLMVSTGVTSNESLSFLLKEQTETEAMEGVLLSTSVRSGLLLLADIRESCYGSNSIEDDVTAMKNCCPVKERKVYHSMMLRVCERKILRKLRSYANRNDRSRKRLRD